MATRPADAQRGELRLLEVGVDPSALDRGDRHQRLAGVDALSVLGAALRDHAVDGRSDRRFREIVDRFVHREP